MGIKCALCAICDHIAQSHFIHLHFETDYSCFNNINDAHVYNASLERYNKVFNKYSDLR